MSARPDKIPPVPMDTRVSGRSRDTRWFRGLPPEIQIVKEDVCLKKIEYLKKLLSIMATLSSTIYLKLFPGILLAAGLGITILHLSSRRPKGNRNTHRHSPHPPSGPSHYGRTGGVVNNVTDLIGNTPLIRINSLSDLTGVEILAKCEFLNPGGSIKDRIALKIIQEAESAGQIKPHTNPRCRVFEGTSGSTGISLAFVSFALGYESEIILPDDTTSEKVQLIENMGATVVKVRPVSISNRSHYVNVARDRAKRFKEQGGRSLFVNQFENELNWSTHYQTTGPEIWDQTGGNLQVFVTGAGTGGTIAGVGKFLKSKDPSLQIVLADPPGSGLFNKVKNGVLFSHTEIEGKRRRHQMDTVVEGIGLNRLTGNVNEIIDTIDDAISVTDEEAIKMSRFILKEEGLFLGSSSAVNLVASYKFAKTLTKKRSDDHLDSTKQGSDDEASRASRLRIVTILCDSGQRHLSKFWNDEYLIQHNILPSCSP